MAVLGVTSGSTDPPDATTEPNVVSLSPMLANLRLDTSVPVKRVPENVLPVVPAVVVVKPEKSRSTVVRRFEDIVALSETPAVRSWPFRVIR